MLVRRFGAGFWCRALCGRVWCINSDQLKGGLIGYRLRSIWVDAGYDDDRLILHVDYTWQKSIWVEPLDYSPEFQHGHDRR